MANNNRAVNNSSPPDPSNPKGIAGSELDPNVSLIPLEVIRTENVISKFPVHNLAKTGRVNIHITRKREDGEVEFHWEVTYNEKYGEAKQLAYQIDTLIIAKRIYDLFESGQAIPHIIPIGSLYQICQELGMNPQSGKNKNNVKRALGQNAGAFIDAKVTYKDRQGEERRLNAQFSRYAVVHRDQKLPDGRRADQVYVVLQPIYHEVLNNARWRPLNFSYLKELPPGAQRCYEIISTRLFAAIKYGHPSAELAYSDYCAYSAQNRQYSYKPFRAQMDHVHKPHLLSGYLEKVEYRQTVDAEGRVDWIIIYFPGPKARAEFSYFNPRLEGIRRLHLDQSAAVSKASLIGQRNTPAQGQTEDEGKTLVRQFHAIVHRDDLAYEPLKREVEQAAQLIKRHGLEAAQYIVQFACREAPKTKFDMQVFGAVLVYEKRALNSYRKREAQQSELFQVSTESTAGQGSGTPADLQPSDITIDLPMLGNALVEARYAALSQEELADYRRRVEEEIKAVVGDRFDWLWDEAVREATIKANIMKLIAEKENLAR